MEIIDISWAIGEFTPVYPGDPETVIKQEVGETSTHSTITMGSHTGSHLDAPSHVFKDGKSIDQLPLDIFYGPCRVLDFSDVKEAVKVSDLEAKDIQEGERILLKTNNSERGFEEFFTDYIYLDGDAAEYLVEKKVKLIGIDSWSIKQKGSKDLRPHLVFLEKNIPIVESINLKNVAEGEYIVIGFPLKLPGLDGSPLRVVLIK